MEKMKEYVINENLKNALEFLIGENFRIGHTIQTADGKQYPTMFVFQELKSLKPLSELSEDGQETE